MDMMVPAFYVYKAFGPPTHTGMVIKLQFCGFRKGAKIRKMFSGLAVTPLAQALWFQAVPSQFV